MDDKEVVFNIHKLLISTAAVLLEPTRLRMKPPGISFMKDCEPSDEAIVRAALRQATMLINLSSEYLPDTTNREAKP